MYQSVQKRNQLLVPQVELEQPFSFVVCPRCGSQLDSCNCSISNYQCRQCGWSHVNHTHASPFQGTLNNQGMIDRILRK